MQIKINNQEYEAELGETILDVCRRENIRIPTLCAHEKLKREAACRLCLVEVNKTEKLVTSCNFKICEGLEVVTESEKIQKAREINMELLWSDHAGKCAGCKKNRRCELQRLAEEYKIENFHFVPRRGEITNQEELDLLRDNWSRVVVDEKNPVLARTTELCVECRRCINICPVKSYGFNHRAGGVVVGTPYEQTLDCIFCGACAKNCPTGAIVDQNNLEEIDAKIKDLKKMAVAIFDPAVLESISLEMQDTVSEEKTAGILKSLGFEKIIDLRYGMAEYVDRLNKELKNYGDKKIIFSSHCPSFSLYVEKYYPELKKNISEVSYPDELLAERIKKEYARDQKINQEDIVVISLSSCTAKKAKKGKHLDYILTVRELGRLMRKNGVKLEDARECKMDDLFGSVETGVSRMIRSGGLAEILKNDMKAVNGVPAIKELLDDIKKRKIRSGFFEATVCPGGCVGGGGQALEITNQKLQIPNR